MSNSWSQNERPAPDLLASNGFRTPIAFVRRLAELTGVPLDLAAAAAAQEHAGAEATWQQSLEEQCRAVGLLPHRVAWSTREAFGAAGRGFAVVGARTGSGELVALDDPRRRRVRVTRGDGTSVVLDLAELASTLAETDLDAPRSWLIVESRFPAAMTPAQGDLDRSGHAPDSHAHPAHGEASLFERLLELLRPERTDLWAIVAYAAAIGALSLATPIAVQQLVNSIAFGGLVQPVVVLALVLLAVLGFSGFLTWVQTFVTELVQERIFVRVAVDLAERMARVEARAFDGRHGPELVNRVFEVVTVQKSLSALLLEGSSAILQIVVGLVILSFYHPLMLAFSLALVVGIFVIVVQMGRRGGSTAIEESKAKYEVFGWLEELARHETTFRGAGSRQFARRRMDALAASWIGARRAHFQIVLRQHGATLALQGIASAALLALGGMLVVQGQLTLGQLVASELIITGVVSTVAKFGKHLERYYDLLASTDKLATLIDLPVERERGDELVQREGAAAVSLVDVDYGHDGARLFSRLNLEVAPGERLAVEGATGSGKSSLLDLLYGLRSPSAGHLTLDDRDYRELALESLREAVVLVRRDEVFSGTIRENVRIGRDTVDDESLIRTLDAVGLVEEVRSLPKSLDTRLSSDGRPLSQVQVSRLMLARALLARPRLILIDRALDDLDAAGRDRIVELLFAASSPWTLVVVSEREDVLARCGRRVRLGSPEDWSRTDRLAQSASQGEPHG